MSEEPEAEPREYPLPGSTPWYNKQAREGVERAIGRISMAFQQLEELVSCLVSQLISDDVQLGTIVTAELSFRNKLGLLSSLYLYRAGATKPPEALKALLATVHRAEEHRNTFLHSYWVKSPVCGVLTRYKYTAKSGKGFVHQTEDLEPENVEAIVTEINGASDNLVAYFDKALPNTAADKVSEALQLAHKAAYKASFLAYRSQVERRKT